MLSSSRTRRQSCSDDLEQRCRRVREEEGWSQNRRSGGRALDVPRRRPDEPARRVYAGSPSPGGEWRSCTVPTRLAGDRAAGRPRRRDRDAPALPGRPGRTARHDTLFPWGTFAVNAAGSFVLGALATTGLHTPTPVMALVGTGLCGALTTYSTFGYETVRLLQDRAPDCSPDSTPPPASSPAGRRRPRCRFRPSPDHLSATDRAGLLRCAVRPASAPAEAAKWSPAPTRTAARRPGPVPESLGGFRRYVVQCSQNTSGVDRSDLRAPHARRRVGSRCVRGPADTGVSGVRVSTGSVAPQRGRPEEAPSPSRHASTTASAFPRLDWSDRMASRSALSASRMR